MFCGECGTRNPDTNQFCRNCGKPLARRQAPAIQPGEQAVAAPSVLSPPPAVTATVTPAGLAAATPKRARNWLGIVSLIPGILSWFILTGVLAIIAILLGIAGSILFRKATGRIGISGIVAIVLAIAAIAVRTVLA